MRVYLCGLLALCACKKAEKKETKDVKAAAVDAAAPAASGELDVVIDGKPVTIRSAKAIATAGTVFAKEGLTVRFWDRTQACEGADKASDYVLELHLPPGPGESYFAGKPVTAEVWSQRALDALPGVSPWDVKLELQPVQPRAGEHVRGSLDIDATAPTETRFHGAIDAEICDTPIPVDLPTTAPDTPFAGPWSHGAQKGDVAAKTVLAFIDGPEHVIRHVSGFAAADVTCAAGGESGAADWYLSVQSFLADRAPIGTVLPAQFAVPAGDTEILDAHAWARVDEVSLDRKELRLTVAVRRKGESLLQIDAGGTLVAKICMADQPADAPPPPKAGAFHVQITEPSGTRDVTIEKDVIHIGRVTSSEVQLTDESVQRSHAMIERNADGTVMLIDMGTLDTRLNGTAVDPAKPATLTSGDTIQVGQTTLVVTF